MVIEAKRDPKNSLKEDYLKESADYWYVKSLILNAKPSLLMALKTEEWDKHQRVLDWLEKVQKILDAIKK